jgi:putative tryptophan/tyrosine transport system substrate-binding protein
MIQRVRNFALAIHLLLWWASVHAQEASIPIIGVLRASSPVQPDPAMIAILGSLRTLGYTEGVNIKLEQRFAERQVERLPQLADELVRLNVKVIVAVNEASLLAAKQATATIPIIVIAYDRDPVAAGLIGSRTRPGGNVTGIYSRQTELAGKRLEVLKETLPGLSQVAVLYDAASRDAPVELELAGKQLGLQLRFVDLKNPKEYAAAIAQVRGKAQGAALLFSPTMFDYRAKIATLAIEAGLPMMSQGREFVVAGALMSYAPDREEVAARTAYFIDRLLRGAKPVDLPFEEGTRFKLTINMKTAKALGVKIPESILLRADEVIR